MLGHPTTALSTIHSNWSAPQHTLVTSPVAETFNSSFSDRTTFPSQFATSKHSDVSLPDRASPPTERTTDEPQGHPSSEPDECMPQYPINEATDVLLPDRASFATGCTIDGPEVYHFSESDKYMPQYPINEATNVSLPDRASFATKRLP